MSNQIRCPGCQRLLIVDVTNNFEVDYSSNLVRDIEDYSAFPPYILEHKCKYCKTLASIYAWEVEKGRVSSG